MKSALYFVCKNKNIKPEGGGRLILGLWFFGPGTHAIASIGLKCSDFSYMVVGLLEKKIRCDWIMASLPNKAFFRPGCMEIQFFSIGKLQLVKYRRISA